MPHLRNERGAGMDFGLLGSLTTARSLGEDADELVVLQVARRALDGHAVSRIAFDGKCADTRENLAHKTASVVEERLTAEQAHPLAGTACDVHAGHVEKRRVVRHKEHARFLVERP